MDGTMVGEEEEKEEGWVLGFPMEISIPRTIPPTIIPGKVTLLIHDVIILSINVARLTRFIIFT